MFEGNSVQDLLAVYDRRFERMRYLLRTATGRLRSSVGAQLTYPIQGQYPDSVPMRPFRAAGKPRASARPPLRSSTNVFTAPARFKGFGAAVALRSPPSMEPIRWYL